jgi:hypothetical protein
MGELAQQPIPPPDSSAADLEASIPDQLKEAGFKYFRFSARANSGARFEEKVRKNPWRRNSFDPIEDAIGARIATAFESDMPWLEQFFRELWVVDDST